MPAVAVAALLLALTCSSQARRWYPVKFISPEYFTYLSGEPSIPAKDCKGQCCLAKDAFSVPAICSAKLDKGL